MADPVPLSPIQQAYEGLYQLALGVCQEIGTFQPELLVSLAYSDLGPLRAAQTVWGHTHPEPFPPVIRINLGVEKYHIYEDWRHEIGMGGFDIHYCSTADFYHYQAWFYQNELYQAEFQAMLSEILPAGFRPKRVLILDEISHGNTRATSFGLLFGLYPNAELRFIAGVQDWTNACGEEWLNTFYPALWQELQTQKTPDNLKQRFPTLLHCRLKQIVVGSEDTRDNSLAMQPLQETSPYVRKLAEQGIRVQDSLACSAWTVSRITDYVTRRLSGEINVNVVLDPDQPWYQCWPMPGKDKVWIEMWTKNGISQPRWARLMGITLAQARDEIRKEWQFYQNIQPAGFGAHTRYSVDPSFQPEISEEQAQGMSFFLKLPGERVMAQGYPGFSYLFETILQEQIGWLLDLTTAPAAPESEHYSPNRNPDWFHHCYYPDLQEAAEEAGCQVTIQNYPIQPYTRG